MMRPRLRDFGDFSWLLFRLVAVPLDLQDCRAAIVWRVPGVSLQRDSRQCDRTDRLGAGFANGPYRAWEYSMDRVIGDLGFAVLCVESIETRRTARSTSSHCARTANADQKVCARRRQPLGCVDCRQCRRVDHERAAAAARNADGILSAGTLGMEARQPGSCVVR